MSRVAENTNCQSAICRDTIYQIALHGHIGAATDADAIGPIWSNGSVVHNPGILLLGVCAGGPRVGISCDAIIATTSHEVIGSGETQPQFGTVRRVAIVKVDAIGPAVRHPAVPDRSKTAAHPLGIA